MRIMIDLDDAAAIKSAHEIIHNALAEPMTCSTCKHLFRDGVCQAGFGDQIDDPSDHFCADWEARQ